MFNNQEILNLIDGNKTNNSINQNKISYGQMFPVQGKTNICNKSELEILIDDSKNLLNRTNIYLNKNKSKKRIYTHKEIQLKRLIAKITLNVNSIKKLYDLK